MYNQQALSSAQNHLCVYMRACVQLQEHTSLLMFDCDRKYVTVHK